MSVDGGSRVTNDQQGPRLAVLGAGVMGGGIATLALAHGMAVLLVEPDDERRAAARADVARQSRLARLMGSASGPPGELCTAADPGHAAGASAVIESVTERREIKAAALAAAAAVVTPGTPLLTTTSSIPVDELADAVPRPGDLAGAHFMNPAYLIDAVEVARGPRTSAETMGAVTALLERLGRRAMVVADAPGFVTSRVLHPMINDAARVVAGGTASVETVDALMRDCLGHRTGPLETADLIGIDNLVDSLWMLHERTGDEGCRPCDLLIEKVRAGRLGRKSGAGFYRYEEGR